jgi:hypothetical protein
MRLPVFSAFLAVLFGALGLIGCAPAFEKRLKGREPVLSRLAVMPVVTIAVEKDFNGATMPKPAWEEAMAKNAGSEVLRLVTARGGFEVPEEKVEDCGQDCLELMSRLMKWGTTSSFEIAAQMHGRADFGVRSVGGWRTTRDYGPLRRAIGADYVLFVVLRDIWDTTGAAIGKVFAGIHSSFRQVGVACIASLVDGRMIWCHVEVDRGGDLRTAPGARRLVELLLGDFWQQGAEVSPPARPVARPEAPALQAPATPGRGG